MLDVQMHTFDSGRIAARVGYLILDPGQDFREPDRLELNEAAVANEFDLVWIQTGSKLETTPLTHQGVLLEMAGTLETALSQARAASQRYEVRALESASDWRRIERLLRFAAPTRFSTDAHIADDSVLLHKLALLRSHVNDKNGAVALAYSSHEAVGYQCTSLEDGSIHLYEIAVDTRFRQGFAALNLVRFILEQSAEAYPGVQRVSTRIYENNLASLRFFRHLGLSLTGRQVHYYHYWPTRSSHLPSRKEARERPDTQRC